MTGVYTLAQRRKFVENSGINSGHKKKSAAYWPQIVTIGDKNDLGFRPWSNHYLMSTRRKSIEKVWSTHKTLSSAL